MASDVNILVVDDSATMRRIIINTLNRLGYQKTAEAADGAEALEQIRQTSFDLVITDWNMPVMDGLALAETLRQKEEYRGLPILMITSRSVKEDIVAAIKTGVNGYIVKPFTIAVLQEKIEQVLSGL